MLFSGSQPFVPGADYYPSPNESQVSDLALAVDEWLRSITSPVVLGFDVDGSVWVVTEGGGAQKVSPTPGRTQDGEEVERMAAAFGQSMAARRRGNAGWR